MPDDLTTLAARESQPDEAREKSRLIAAFRAGVDEQPEPVANDRPAIGELVIDDIRARMDVGRERYGTVLQAFNRRDALTDAYHEAIDLTKYIRQEIAERDERDAVHEAMREVEATLAARTESLEAALASRAAMESERDTLKAECDRLRGLVREAVAGLKKIADHGKGFTDEQMHLRIYAATYYRWAKDDAAALVARLGAE